ncbi:CcoQ/FixQ family Cbb3-type cytochrome c oxidase assembly chaperone [Litorivita pollutaquae]|uniref:CcoQ/FixQ family Cbb3-type cytochrome c oxidase assembly chaperone n=1 Tax=Litorivita pollutaquae TaxID=2200892 RepID=A0A2V4MJ14_9RHOB|nr:cbb3-type cytochrome c oxidase subunit 3 [Litorivita pollutaquae]OUS22887.1 cbb3-type cytochrome C oxidase subunit 3 [Rhodobacterales bacterium 59_46_T64]PYC46575.1 CcoQ/FixQ family Cbb3-type cytochrome c oxidase assembly chaperone [Litorivita pollutaquae]
METYSFLREFADSWMLMVLFAFFIGVILFVFRPGASKIDRDIAEIPFRHEDKPAPARNARAKEV